MFLVFVFGLLDAACCLGCFQALFTCSDFTCSLLLSLSFALSHFQQQANKKYFFLASFVIIPIILNRIHMTACNKKAAREKEWERNGDGDGNIFCFYFNFRTV